MQARTKEKREVAKGTLLVTFDLLGEEVDFTPGEYFFVTLLDVGYRDNKGLRRHVTVVTSPNEEGVLGFATRDRDHGLSEHAPLHPGGGALLSRDAPSSRVETGNRRRSSTSCRSSSRRSPASAHPDHDPGPRLGGGDAEDRPRFFRDYLGEDVNENTFLVAGPPAMVEGMQEALEEAGVEAENVIAERYSGY